MAEAKSFLADDVLGPRLVEISSKALEHLESGSRINKLMGSGTDAMKLLSCSTLFSYASKGTEFEDLFDRLRKCCAGQMKKEDDKSVDFCESTLIYLQQNDSSNTAAGSLFSGPADGAEKVEHEDAEDCAAAALERSEGSERGSVSEREVTEDSDQDETCPEGVRDLPISSEDQGTTVSEERSNETPTKNGKS